LVVSRQVGTPRRSLGGVRCAKVILSSWKSLERCVALKDLTTTFDVYVNAQLTVHDVFFLDSGFAIERPTRYYRQNLVNLLNHSSDPKTEGKDKDHISRPQSFQIHLDPPEDEHRSVISSIKTSISKIFQIEPSSSKNSHEQPKRHGRVRIGHGHTQGDNASIASTVSSSIASTVPSRAPTPMFDPSTNADPLTINAHDGDDENAQQKRKDGYKTVSRTDVSKHTFYIVNSQMRLKLIAKNEVLVQRSLMQR
jgi:phospholipase D1/2